MAVAFVVSAIMLRSIAMMRTAFIVYSPMALKRKGIWYGNARGVVL